MKRFFAIVFCLLYSFSFFADDIDFSELEKRERTLLYGLESDVINLIDTLIKDKDYHFTDQLFSIYKSSQNILIREKIIVYFTNAEDLRLKEIVLETLEDPWDEKKQVVRSMLQYAAKLKIKEAAPFLLQLLETEDESYFESAVSAIGKIGGVEEALALVEYYKNESPSLIKKQNLMKALSSMEVDELWDFLVEIIENEDENTYVRMYASEALGKTKNPNAISILIDLFTSTDVNIRVYAIKGLSNFDDEKALAVLLEALKDNHQRVRLEAIEAFRENLNPKAVDSLLYRAETDPEKNVKTKAYEVLGKMQTESVKTFFKKAIEDKKHNVDLRIKASAVVIEEEISELFEPIIELAKETLKDDKQKTTRYALGKEFAKKKNPAFEEICSLYLDHSDVSTKGTGLDIFVTNVYKNLIPKVQSIANNEKEGANQKKARLVLERAGLVLE